MATSIRHEGPLLLLGKRPELLLALLGSNVPVAIGGGAKVSMGSADFSEAVPLERRADAVVTVEEDGHVTCAFVVELQLAIDEEKAFTWPLYVASLHSRLRCPAMLVVIALDEAVAAWARRPIVTLQPSHPLAPFVIGPE